MCQVDVYAFAMCLLEMVDGRLPWHGYGGGAPLPPHRIRIQSAAKLPTDKVPPYCLYRARLSGGGYGLHPPRLQVPRCRTE